MALISTPSTEVVIGCAMRVHDRLGPGLFESVYHPCVGVELRRAELRFEEQVAIGVRYDDLHVPVAFRADFIVQQELVVEIKSIDSFHPVHTRQMLTYMKLAGIRKGLLINFNVALLKYGLKSFVL